MEAGARDASLVVSYSRIAIVIYGLSVPVNVFFKLVNIRETTVLVNNDKDGCLPLWLTVHARSS